MSLWSTQKGERDQNESTNQYVKNHNGPKDNEKPMPSNSAQQSTIKGRELQRKFKYILLFPTVSCYESRSVEGAGKSDDSMVCGVPRCGQFALPAS